jgi:hypothetical protein
LGHGLSLTSELAWQLTEQSLVAHALAGYASRRQLAGGPGEEGAGEAQRRMTRLNN